jgi:uncharacterized small protein (DUF1192 family)
VTIQNPAAIIGRRLRPLLEPSSRVFFDLESAMAAIDDDDRPKKKVAHEIGQDLSLLSVKELDERIALLQGEIARLEANKIGKQASRQTADQFFKK